jgi:hypothetical protein
MTGQQRPRLDVLYGLAAAGLFALGLAAILVGYEVADAIAFLGWMVLLAVPMLWVAAAVFGALALVQVVKAQP